MTSTLADDLITRLASDEGLDEAYVWLCERRKEYPAEDDVWEFRRHWPDRNHQIQRTLLADDYAFSPLREVRLPDETLQIWCAQDALVLKAMAMVLGGGCAPPGDVLHTPHLL